MKSKGLSCSTRKKKNAKNVLQIPEQIQKILHESRFTIYNTPAQFLVKYMFHLYCIYIFHEYFTLSHWVAHFHLPDCLLDGSAVQGDSNSIGASHVYQVPGETTKKKWALTKLELPKKMIATIHDQNIGKNNH